MATITYTPNLSLKVSSDDDAVTKYNLNRIDYLAQKITIAVSGNTQVSSSTNVDIYAAYGLGVNRYNGVITLDAGNLGTFDTSSRVQVNAKQFNVATNGGTISLDAASVDFNGAAPTGLGLDEGKILIGNASDEAEAQTMSGDATLAADGTITISAEAIGTGKIAGGAVTGSKIASETITNDNINGSAGIEYGKLDLTGGIVDADVSPSALIDQSKINGLVGALAGKEPTVTKGDLTASPASVLSVNGGTGAVIGSGASITIPRASAYDSGYLHVTDYNRFNNYAPAATSDITTSTDGVIIVGGEDIVPDGDGCTIDIATADSTHTGLLTSTDWNTFNGKEAGGAVSAHESAYNHTSYDNHVASTSNPHSVTKTQVGLGNVTNDAQLPIAGGTMTGQIVLDNQGILFNTADDYVGTPAEGTLWWNKDDHTINIQGDVAGTSLQVGQENWLRAKNETGAPIPEGAAVYISGANTARPTIALAIANAVATSDKTLGVATHTIAHGDLGVVTTFGLVRSITTNVDGDGVSLADGDPIYLSSTTAGEWVKAKPHAPNHCIRIGQVVNAAAGGAGNIFISVNTGAHLQDLHDVNIETALADNQVLQYDSVTQIWNNVTLSHTHLADIGSNTHSQIDTFLSNEATIKSTTGEITGFEDPANTDISYDSTARTVTFTHSSGTIAYWSKGVRYTQTSPWTPDAHDLNLGFTYFGSITSSNVWQWTTSLPDIFSNSGTVYAVTCRYTSSYKFGIRECHGLMQWQTWYNLHNSQGTVHLSGGLVTGGSYTLNTNTIAAVTPDMDSAVILDEDLPTSLPALTGGTYMRMYLDTNAVVFSSGSVPYLTSGANPSTDNPQYNQNPVSGTALTTISTNNRWFNVYGMEVPVTSDVESQNYRWLWITGQTIYTTLASAQAEDFRTLQLGNFTAVAQEFVPRVRLTFRRIGSNLTYNTQLNAEPSYLVGGRVANTSVTITASSAPATRYTATLSWSGVGPYTMAIAGSTHLRGNDPLVRVRELISGTTYEVVGVDVQIDDSTGDVVITSTENISGKVLII